MFDRREFFGLFASAAAGVLVRKARADEIPAMAEVVHPEEPEVLEYATNMEVTDYVFATVRGQPLRLEKNHGFRYVARSKHGVRLVFARPLKQILVVCGEACDGGAQGWLSFSVGQEYIEARAFSLTGEEIPPIDFHVFVRELRPVG